MTEPTRFEDRVSDFGRSELPAPFPMVVITMPDGEVWRLKLDDGEEPSPYLVETLELQASLFISVNDILYS